MTNRARSKNVMMILKAERDFTRLLLPNGPNEVRRCVIGGAFANAIVICAPADVDSCEAVPIINKEAAEKVARMWISSRQGWENMRDDVGGSYIGGSTSLYKIA